MTRLTQIIPAATLALLLLGGTAGATVTRTLDTGGTTYSTTAMTGFNTFGDTMDGMTVTAFFSDATSETRTWAATGFGAGGVTGTKGGGWSLSQTGDTFFFPFQLSNNTGVKMTKFTFDGSPVTTFDTSFGLLGLQEGTPGSNIGRDFTETAPFISGLSIDVLYHGALQLGANPPIGDEYVLLDATFTNADGLASGKTLNFIQDTDNATTDVVEIPPVIIPQVPGVPEPSTFVLAALGFLGMGFVALRRKYHRG